MYKLVSRGAIFDQNYNKINDELEKVFKDHKTNMKKAYLEHDSRINDLSRLQSTISLSKRILINLKVILANWLDMC